MCGTLYLPMFLLRVELLTLTEMEPLIVLAKLCPLPIMLKSSTDLLWSVIVTPRRHIVEDNISCDTFIQRRILEENIPGRHDRAILQSR